MSDALLKIQLDLSDVTKALDDLTKRFEASMAKNAKATGRVGAAMGKMGKMIKGGLAALGITAGIAGMKTLAGLALNVGENMEKARDKFAAGSKRRKAAGGDDAKNAGASVVAAAQLEDLISRMKIGAGDMILSFANGVKTMSAGVTGAFNSFTSGIAGIKPPEWLSKGWGAYKDALKGGVGAVKDAIGDTDAGKAAKKAADEEAAKQAEANRKGEVTLRLKEEVRSVEERIAESEKTGLVTHEQKRYLLLKQVELAKAQSALAHDEIAGTREAQNASDAAMGRAAVALEQFDNERAKGLKIAEEESAEVDLHAMGLQHIADLNKKIAGFDDQILQARRDQNAELEKALTKQKNIAKTQALAVAHAVSPKEKRDERTRIRKEKSAAKKQQAKFDAVTREEKGAEPTDFKAALKFKTRETLEDMGARAKRGALGSVAAKRDLGRRGEEARAFQSALTATEKLLGDIAKNTQDINQNAR